MDSMGYEQGTRLCAVAHAYLLRPPKLAARGTWRMEGEPVRPDATRGSALVTAVIDAARKHCMTAAERAHYGIFSGRVWGTQISPQIRDLIYRYQPG